MKKVDATWVGTRAGRPCIMLAVRSGFRHVIELIPDSVEGFSVYYLEGDPK